MDAYTTRLVTNRANDGPGVEVNVATDSQAIELWGGRSGSGMMAMAQMPDDEFEMRLAMLEKGGARIQQIKRSLMKEGTHYGVIPGTNKPSLLKPGAEVLCNVYGLRPDFVPVIEYGDGISSPPIRVTVRAEFHLGDLSGPVVGIGLGAGSSWERRYRYRRGERSCPACGSVGSVIKGKAEYGGGWLCWAKKGGCGAKFEEGDAEITAQAVGDVENPDQHDLLNTLIKMAAKRSQIDGALRVTGSSDLFTQDVDEGVVPDEESDTSGGGTYEQPEQTPRAAAPAPKAAATRPAPAKAAPPKQEQKAAQNGDRWHDPCPKCGKKGSVIKNSYGPGFLCWTKGRIPGCGYKFTAEDAAFHQGAAEVREESGDTYEVKDEDVPF